MLVYQRVTCTPNICHLQQNSGRSTSIQTIFGFVRGTVWCPSRMCSRYFSMNTTLASCDGYKLLSFSERLLLAMASSNCLSSASTAAVEMIYQSYPIIVLLQDPTSQGTHRAHRGRHVSDKKLEPQRWYHVGGRITFDQAEPHKRPEKTCPSSPHHCLTGPSRSHGSPVLEVVRCLGTSSIQVPWITSFRGA